MTLVYHAVRLDKATTKILTRARIAEQGATTPLLEERALIAVRGRLPLLWGRYLSRCVFPVQLEKRAMLMGVRLVLFASLEHRLLPLDTLIVLRVLPGHFLLKTKPLHAKLAGWEATQVLLVQLFVKHVILDNILERGEVPPVRFVLEGRNWMCRRMNASYATKGSILIQVQLNVIIAITQKAMSILRIEPSATTAGQDFLLIKRRTLVRVVSRGNIVLAVLMDAFLAMLLLVSSERCHNKVRAFTVARGRKQILL